MGGEEAFESALRLLERRDYAARDLERRLAARGLPADDVREALDRLLSSGLVDDARYARARASVLASRGAGDDLIRAELERSGVSPEHVTAALAVLEPESERAEEVLRRRGASLRTARYLRAKGFDDELVRSLVANGRAGELG